MLKSVIGCSWWVDGGGFIEKRSSMTRRARSERNQEEGILFPKKTKIGFLKAFDLCCLSSDLFLCAVLPSDSDFPKDTPGLGSGFCAN